MCDNLVWKKLVEDWLLESFFKRCLIVLDLIFLGVGLVVGVGFYVVMGELVCDMVGFVVIFLFFFVGFVVFFFGICYVEFGCCILKVGFVYIYFYVLVGEFWVFFVGWNMILEYYISVVSVV